VCRLDPLEDRMTPTRGTRPGPVAVSADFGEIGRGDLSPTWTPRGESEVAAARAAVSGPTYRRSEVTS